MTYEELKREISSRSITQLPGLLQHVARLCGIKPVFKDKEAMLAFVSRAYDTGPASESALREDPYEPKGIKFWSQSRKQEMILISEGEPYANWLCYKHPDGQWVALRKAIERDFQEIQEAVRSSQ